MTPPLPAILASFQQPVPYLIAEIGGNHEGRFEEAEKLCRLALAAGADCVKFQLYRADGLVNPVQSPDRHAHFRRFELTREQHRALAEMCREAGRDYNASVWDLGMLDWVDEYLPFYKIGSGDVTARPVVRAFARRGKPIVLSTGLSTLDEVRAAVEDIRSTNPVYRNEGMITLLQCTSMYPIPDGDANLRAMESLAGLEGVWVGYSDHTVGMEALIAASAMGARVLEFHFTDQREGRTFRDHQVSLLPDELPELRRRLVRVAAFRGPGGKSPLPCEEANGHVVSFRRGLYPVRDLPAGTVLQPDDVACLRPAVGIPADAYDQLIGRRLVVPVTAGQALAFDLFEPAEEDRP
jgi:N-acetylneuraminate synthase/N,N'-diacetyllegionaminate synthase